MTFNFLSPVFITLIIVGPVFILGGVMMRVFQPKKINRLFGYRTDRSMENQKAWDYAQKFSSRLLIQSGVVLMLLAFAGTLLENVSNGMQVVIALIVTILGAAYPIYKTERELKKLSN